MARKAAMGAEFHGGKDLRPCQGIGVHQHPWREMPGQQASEQPGTGIGPARLDHHHGRTMGGNQPIRQDNRNPLLGRVNGADGLKTGHTEEAGYGFTGSAARDGRRIVMVVAGLTSFNQRIEESVRLMQFRYSGSFIMRSGGHGLRMSRLRSKDF